MANNCSPSPTKRAKYGVPSCPSSPSASSTRTSYTGFVQKVHEIQQSQNQSQNLYFDLDLQIAEDEVKTIRVMVQKGQTSKHQLFLDKLNAQQPVMLTNLQVTTTGMIFLNKGTIIQDAPSHTIQFPFQPAAPTGTTSIDTILKKHTSGTFTVSGCVKWLGPAAKPENASKMVRDAEFTDSSAKIHISIWDQHIEEIEEGQFYTLTNCRLKHYYGKRLSTTSSTTITQAEVQDISSVETKEDSQNLICCPEILNVSANLYPVCNNRDCRKKISENPGSKIVQCLHCNRAMLVKNCYADMNINFHLEKEEKQFSATAFPKAVSTFLEEDIFDYRENIAPLIERLLLLEHVDFELSPNGKSIISMKQHADSAPLETDLDGTG